MAYTRVFPPSFLYGVYADRPVESLVTGQLYLVTDIDPNRVYIWTGSAWIEIARGWSEEAGPDYADRYSPFALVAVDTSLPNHRVLTGGEGISIADSGAGDNVTVSLAGYVTLAVVTKTGDYTATSSDAVIIVDASANTVTITLPTASGITGRCYTIKCIDATFAVDVDGDGAETIDGQLTQALNQWDSIDVISDGTNFLII